MTAGEGAWHRKDISAKRFNTLCQENGFIPEDFWGYYKIGNGVSVSVLNAGSRRRDQFAYLLEMKRKHSRLPARGE